MLKRVFDANIVNIRNECLNFWVHMEWIGAWNKQIAREPFRSLSDLFVPRSDSFLYEPGKKDIHSLSTCSWSRKGAAFNAIKGAAVAEWLSSWLAEQEVRGSIPGLATWIFRDWLSPASKSRYGWKIAKSTLILKTTNLPT